MRGWPEFVDFVRGRRERPAPGPKRPRATALLVAGSLLHLPIVYLLVRDDAIAPPYTIVTGLLAMGLAWSAGVSLEGRRQGTVRIIGALAVLEAALAFTPVIGASLGPARWLFVLGAAFAAGALLEARRG